MSLASVSIRNPVFAWMLMFGFIVFGYVGFSRLPVGQYPDVDIPVININATLEGAAPEVMESDVVDVIEDAVMAVEGIREVNSTCRQGSASVTIEFELSRNIEQALQDVQAKVSAATRLLPKEMDPPTISKTNPEENPIMWVALSGTRSQQAISSYAKNVLRDRFLTVEGNGDVMMGGYLDRNVRIWLKADALEAQGLSADEVIAALQREHVEAPAGRMEGSMREANVRIEGEAFDINAVKNLVVATRADSPIYLKDVALVEDGFEDRRRIARSNGYPAQGMGIIKQHGANTVEVADSVKARLEELKKTLPEGLSLDIRTDTSKPVKEAINEIYLTLGLAVVLTAFVCWLFLGSISSTLNVVLAIPVSIFGTFAVMYFLGFSLNTFSLLAISLSVGIVVDDAVMVLENIYRHAEMGKNKVIAARDGTDQISFAALAATLAIIAIFLPVAFMSGLIGKFFLQFGVVLSVAVAISLLEALTLAPARCSQFLHVGQRQGRVERMSNWVLTGLSSFYRLTLTHVLQFRSGLTGRIVGLLPALAGIGLTGFLSYTAFKSASALADFSQLQFVILLAVLAIGAGAITVMLFALVLRSKQYPTGAMLVMLGSCAGFVFSLSLLGWIPKEMSPQQDIGYFMVRVETPVGSTVDYTDNVMKEIEKMLVDRAEIDSTLIIAGAGGAGASDVTSGLGFITLKPRDERTLSQQQSINALRKLTADKFPGCNVFFVDVGGLPGNKRGGAQVDFSIRGENWDTLGVVSEQFVEEMRSSGNFVDVISTFKKGMPEVQVTPNREKTLANNVDIKKLTETVSALVGGSRVAKFKDNGRRYDIRVRLLKDDRGRTEDIGNIFIRNREGRLVRLSDVADIITKPSLQTITRQNRMRAVTISANPNPNPPPDKPKLAQAEALTEIDKMAARILPSGYSHTFGGSAKVFQESFSSLLFAMVLGLIVAYMVLASQFNSFIHPITVLMAMPFSLSGAFLALYWTGQSLNIYSMIGIFLLLGIVKKNSILLVDYTNQVKDAGKSREEALIEACPVRLRPILMTTCATIAGALPAALSIGPGGELRIPMSVAIIGGLTLSTFLTLFVVPCFYSLVDEAREYLGFNTRPHELLDELAVPVHATEQPAHGHVMAHGAGE